MKKETIATVKIEASLAEAIEQRAREENITKSEWMRRSLKHAITEGLEYEVTELITVISRKESRQAPLPVPSQGSSSKKNANGAKGKNAIPIVAR